MTKEDALVAAANAAFHEAVGGDLEAHGAVFGETSLARYAGPFVDGNVDPVAVRSVDEATWVGQLLAKDFVGFLRESRLPIDRTAKASVVCDQGYDHTIKVLWLLRSHA